MATQEQKDFLKELQTLTNDLKRDIEAKAQGLDTNPKSILARRKKVLSGNFKFFVYKYFPHHMWGEQSDFQREVCELIPKLLLSPSGSIDWWVAPRGEGKSTIVTKIAPVYVAVLALLQIEAIRQETGLKAPPIFIDYCLIFGAETKFPTKLLTVLKTELEFNPALKLDFPEVSGKTDNWKVAEMRTKSGVYFEPRGAEQAVRGAFQGSSRPKLMFGDDLITDKEAKSPTECKNRWEWVSKSLVYLGSPDGTVKFFGVGTTLSNNDPIAKARASVKHRVHIYKALIKEPKNMHLWNECEAIMRNDDIKVNVVDEKELPSYKFYLKNKKAMDKGSIISWASVRPLFWLMRERADNRPAFNTELQANPRSEEDKVFTGITFWTNRSNKWVHYGSCDPSMGKTASADPSSIIVGAKDLETNKLHIISSVKKRRVMSKLTADILAAQTEYNCVMWGFENNNAYEAMRLAIVDDAMRQGIMLPMRGITTIVSQNMSIDSLEPLINSVDPKILFHAKQLSLLDELDTYPEKQQSHHYDELMGLVLLTQVALNSRLSGIPQITSAKIGSYKNQLNRGNDYA